MTALMRLTTQPPAVRRAVALALLAAAVIAVAALMSTVAGLASSQREWRDAARTRLADLKGRAATTDALRESLARMTAAPVWNGFYTVAAGSDGGSLIHGDVAALCAQVGATLQSVTPLPSSAERGLGKYGARFSATMTARQLQGLIGALRERTPYLRADSLTISAPQMQAPDEDPMLTVTLEVVGYAKEPQA